MCYPSKFLPVIWLVLITVVRLSKYAPEEVATDKLKRDKFEKGLILEIREKIVIKPPTYRDLLEAALRAEEIIT